jgi:hypothetical protein
VTLAHAAALCCTAALRLLPRRLRWHALLLVSAAAAPLVRRVGVEPGMGIDGFREIALWKLMMAAGEAGIAYDPVVEQRGLPPLPAGSGLLVVGPHSLLNYLAVRHLHDRGRDPVVVSAEPSIPIFGTTHPPRSVAVSPTLLADVVRHLRGGDTVCAMIDRAEAAKGTFRVDTALGPIHVAEPMLKFALGCDVEILFCTFRIEAGKAIGTWSAAPREAGIGAVCNAFAAFLKARIAEGHGAGGPRALALATGEGGALPIGEAARAAAR